MSNIIEDKAHYPEDSIFRLAKPKKKGLLALIFSRFILIVLFLAIQIGIILLFYLKLNEYFPHFYVVMIVFTVCMVAYLFSSSIDATAKLTWLLLIAVAPIVGALLLMYTQTNLGHRKLKEREADLINSSKDILKQDEEVLKELLDDGGDVDDLVLYMNRSGCFPAYKNCEVKYFPLGEYMFKDMLEELKKAEKYIFMEFFIIEEGYMWGEILRILIDKVKEGVDVRVMYDGMCEISTLPADYWKKLEENGIRSKPFAPLAPVLSSHYNYRDHRKILVIDGKCAFTGGVNLADEYINRIERFGHWKDTGVMIKGQAAESYTLMFLQMWNIHEEEPKFAQWLDGSADTYDAGGYVIPYCDCPLDDDKVGEVVYIDMLNRAGTYVHIMTPYLILDGELETALKYAAERGVDVTLILPGIPDKKAAYSLAKSHYHSLVKAGVKIYEYSPGFVHAKVAVSDDERAVVGTINLDYRSLYHHFECAAYLYKVPCLSEIEKDFQETLAKCRKVTPETIKKEKFGYKILGVIVKFIAPLM